MATRKFVLESDEYVLAIVPEYASGPGWSNRPLWVYIARRATGTTLSVREECLQPEEWTREINALFPILAAAHGAMMRAVREDRVRTVRGGTK